MHWKRFGLLGLLVAGCGEFLDYGECQSSPEYRYVILALRDGEKFAQGNARIRCTEWSKECSSQEPDVARNCKCLAYLLSSDEGFLLRFPPLEEGGSFAIPGGKLVITSKSKVLAGCASGNNFVEYAGVFEGVIQGRTYRRGVFYAPGEP
jgi:hypothetical protein